MPLRRDPVYRRQRLRRDAPSAVAVFGAVIACGAALIALIQLLMPASHVQQRASPLYWALLLPFGWWAAKLGSYEPGASRTLTLALIAGPTLSAICLSVALMDGKGATPWIVALGISLMAAATSAVFYPRSLLKREGPAR